MGIYVQFLTSPHVLPLRSMLDSRGSDYDLQYVSILRFLKQHDEAKQYVDTYVVERIKIQVRIS